MLLELSYIQDRDELIGPAVTQDILNEAHQYLYELARQVGVAETDIQPTFLVRRFLTLWTLRETAIRKSFSAGGAAFQSGQTLDAFAQKVHVYDGEIKQLLPKLTAENLTGKNPDQPFRAVRLYRG